MFNHAILRKPGENCALGLTTSDDGAPNVRLMQKQHEAYASLLKSLGLELIILKADNGYPDGYFVEDVAVVAPEVAIITNPGAPTRQGEEDTIEPVLANFKKIERIWPPGTVEGGDVLMINKHFFVGISERTNEEGFNQFGRIVESFGYTCTPVPVGAGLHLKSSVSYVGKNTLLLSGDFEAREEFEAYEKIVLDEAESYAGNTLFVNDTLIMPAGFPRTKEDLQKLGQPIIELDVSEARKMDGGLTCMSLRF